VVKLSRVVLLAPLVTATSMHRRRREATAAGAASSRKKTPIMPLFVVGVLVAMTLRSVHAVPKGWIENLKTADTLCLAAGMFAVGTGTSLRELRRLGGRPLVLGLTSWLLVAGVALTLTLVTR
jgi:uncharacterized membrane protein YadS